MKIISSKIVLTLLSLVSCMLLIQSCSDDSAPKSVDLRYRVEDSYEVNAIQHDKVTFLVKSSDPWKVFGTQDWYSVTPSVGNVVDSIYTVAIQCVENTHLDDRIDTLTIKSDYWIGKKFTLLQKGIAFLNVTGSNFELPQEKSEDTFTIEANQKWSVKVSQGEEWLTISSKTEGELNGQVTVEATANKGEKRNATVTIFDRHGVACETVTYVQDGVMLNPMLPENGKWFELYEAQQQLSIPVESNGEWTVAKIDEEDSAWFTFEKVDFNGSESIVVNVSEHVGTTVRTAVIRLQSKSEEGILPVVKEVKFKQANPQIPVVLGENKTISGMWYGPGELQPGYYNFYIQPMPAATKFNLFMTAGDYEIRYWLQDGKTVPSTRPWSADVFIENKNCHKPVDYTKNNVISLDIKESIDENGKSWTYVEWILNGEKVCYRIANGITLSGSTDSWVMPWEKLNQGMSLMVNVTGGKATLAKFEYIAPLVWGE